MHTAIIIPARLGATRLPNKPLLPLGDRPLVIRTAQQAQKTKKVDHVLIATDASEIAEAANKHGVDVVITRGDHLSGTDRVAEAASKLAVEYVINLQADEPFVEPQDLASLFAALESRSTDLATLRAPLGADEYGDPNTVKVVTRDDGLALYFSRAPIPYDRQQSGRLDGVFRHIGVYAYQADALERLSRAPRHFLEEREGLEQLRAMALGMSIVVLDAETQSRGIDTEEDIIWAQDRVKELGEAAFP